MWQMQVRINNEESGYDLEFAVKTNANQESE